MAVKTSFCLSVADAADGVEILEIARFRTIREEELEQELMQSTQREHQQQEELEQLRKERSRLQEQVENLECEYTKEKTKLTQQLSLASETEKDLRDQLTGVQKQLDVFLEAKKKEGDEKRELELAERQKKPESEEERILRISEEYRTSSRLYVFIYVTFFISPETVQDNLKKKEKMQPNKYCKVIFL